MPIKVHKLLEWIFTTISNFMMCCCGGWMEERQWRRFDWGTSHTVLFDENRTIDPSGRVEQTPRIPANVVGTPLPPRKLGIKLNHKCQHKYYQSWSIIHWVFPHEKNAFAKPFEIAMRCGADAQDEIWNIVAELVVNLILAQPQSVLLLFKMFVQFKYCA